MRKRIHNKEQEAYYALQQRNGNLRRGQIKGKWHNVPKEDTYKQKYKKYLTDD